MTALILKGTSQENSSSAEVDFVELFDGMVIPIENKSGKIGTLRSLHQFMEIAPHRFAVRLYAGRLEITEARTPRGRSFRLLNLPYYLELSCATTWIG